MASASFPQQNGGRPAISGAGGGPMMLTTTHHLTLEQNGWLNSLWKTYSRELVDVRPSFEDKDSSLFIPSNNKSSTAAKLQPHCQHAYNFCLRLHAFFLAFLTQNDHLPADSQSLFVKKFEQSCLRDYASIVFVTTARPRRPNNNNNNTQLQQRRLLRLRSLSSGGGRRSVLFLHHEEFLQEFNHFELHGQAPSSDFIRRDSFGSFLYHMPEDALQALGCAMALALVTLHYNSQQQQRQLSADNINTQLQHQKRAAFLSTAHAFCDTTKIVVRFRHVQPVVHMMDIKTGLVGKYITVKGHVVKARPRRLRVATAEFICQKCGTMLTHALVDGRYTTPTRCISASFSSSSASNNNGTHSQHDSSCKGRSFALGQTTMARYIDVQELRLQEAQEESTIHVGRTPRQLRVDVTHDLVDACRPGDVVLVVATVAAINTAAGRRGKISKETSTYSLYLKAHSITTMSESDIKRGGGGGAGGGGQQHGENNNNIAYTQQQLQKIVQLCHADHRYFSLHERRAFPFDLLVRSLCPSIIGHHEVKAGLVLCLLGGTPPSHQGGGATGADRGISIRSNSHMLIVGDPGMGKSQMLLAANQLAARSVYVGGNTSSTTGLTVTLTKEDRGESGIEAGALVLADQGICCIDEFDKMAKNHQDGLLEAMEQQQVSIAKAGVVASLPARCSVIAAANPKQGSYNLSRTVAENLNMSKPILSRFDLVFVLRDRADKDLDRLVSTNIMNLYRGGSESNGTSTAPTVQACTAHTINGQHSQSDSASSSTNSRLSLSSRLAWVADFQKQPLPADLLRDYIAYAREYCKPKLTPEAATVLKDFFMELRYPADGKRKQDSVPITTRQLEALIRLCQARAKACLRDFVLREDALDVVELMSRSMEQVHTDETGNIDPARGGAGGTSKRKVKKAFIAQLQSLVGVRNTCTLDDLRRIANNVKCDLNDFHSIIEDLRANGFLTKQPDGKYCVLS